MKVVEEEQNIRSIDTFAARDLHKLRKPPSIEDYIDFGLQSGYTMSATQEPVKEATKQ